MKLRNMTSVYFVEQDRLLCLYRIGSRVVGNKHVGAAGGHFEKEERNIEMMKEAVKAIRNVRTSMNVPPSRKANVFVV